MLWSRGDGGVSFVVEEGARRTPEVIILSKIVTHTPLRSDSIFVWERRSKCSKGVDKRTGILAPIFNQE